MLKLLFFDAAPDEYASTSIYRRISQFSLSCFSNDSALSPQPPFHYRETLSRHTRMSVLFSFLLYKTQTTQRNRQTADGLPALLSTENHCLMFSEAFRQRFSGGLWESGQYLVSRSLPTKTLLLSLPFSLGRSLHQP